MDKIYPGKIFGELTVLKDSLERDSSRHKLWLCQCSCGKVIKVRSSNLTNGNTKSCGHKKIRKNLLNQKFGLLTVIEDCGNDKKGNSTWKCLCECGNIKIIKGTNLVNGNTISCGCNKMSKGELKIKTILEENNIKYIQEYEPLNLKGKRFDFALLNSDNSIYRLIEFDGIQHFENWYLDEKDSLKQRQQRDLIKNKYCLDNNIQLIRIPYWELENISLSSLVEDKFLV